MGRSSQQEGQHRQRHRRENTGDIFVPGVGLRGQEQRGGAERESRGQSWPRSWGCDSTLPLMGLWATCESHGLKGIQYHRRHPQNRLSRLPLSVCHHGLRKVFIQDLILQQINTCQRQPFSDGCHCRLVTPVLELHINRIIQ